MSEQNQISEALLEIAQQLKNLGNGSATSNNGIGATEGMAMKVAEAGEKIASALDGVADAIENLAQAVGVISFTK